MPEPHLTESKQDSVPFYPDHLRTELRVVAGLLVIAVLIGIAATFFPVGIGAPADPMDTPAHVKPEWYFLALYQLLKFIPKTTGALIPVILVAVLTLWPFFDSKANSSRMVRIRLAAVVFGVILLVALTIWGEVS